MFERGGAGGHDPMAQIARLGDKVMGAGIQLHGGIGMTREHDLHLYLKRAKTSELAFGDAAWQRERVARLISQLFNVPAAARCG